MKLNEKSLVKFASSGVPPDKEGYLYKRGDFNKGFQKRWFVLKGNLLFYYDRRIDKEPIGLVILEGCTIELSDHEDGFTFMIQFPGSDTRTYIMKSDSQEDMEAWMKMLSSASYDYMRVCVNELKSQLDDAGSNKKLLQEAVLDRNSLSDSMKSWHVTSKNNLLDFSNVAASKNSVITRRHNPFDTDDSLDDEDGYVDRNSEMRQARTFLEMHEEYRIQIQEIMGDWKKQQQHSTVARQQTVV